MYMLPNTEWNIADQTFYLTQYTDTRPTSPSTDPIAPGWVAPGVPIFKSLVWLDLEEILAQAENEPWVCRCQGGHLNY